MRRLAAACLLTAAVSASSHDPFAFFQPAIAVSPADRARLAAGEVYVHVLPARDGEVAVFAASRIDTAPDTFIAWTQAIAQFKQSSSYVQAIGRFSSPPVTGDLDSLTLDDDDLEAIRKCRPGDCGVKLQNAEIQALRVAISRAGAGWRDAVQREFRQLLLARVAAPLPAAGDRIVFRDAGYPAVEGDVIESFYYWSKERYGAGKPVVAATHVTLIRPDGVAAPAVVSLNREVFVTHYRDASLSLTAVIADGPGGPLYLAYLNRSHVDVLGGLFGGLKRMVIEGRIRSETGTLLTTTRRRLEGGLPAAP